MANRMTRFALDARFDGDYDRALDEVLRLTRDLDEAREHLACLEDTELKTHEEKAERAEADRDRLRALLRDLNDARRMTDDCPICEERGRSHHSSCPWGQALEERDA